MISECYGLKKKVVIVYHAMCPLILRKFIGLEVLVQQPAGPTLPLLASSGIDASISNDLPGLFIAERDPRMHVMEDLSSEKSTGI